MLIRSKAGLESGPLPSARTMEERPKVRAHWDQAHSSDSSIAPVSSHTPTVGSDTMLPKPDTAALASSSISSGFLVIELLSALSCWTGGLLGPWVDDNEAGSP